MLIRRELWMSDDGSAIEPGIDEYRKGARKSVFVFGRSEWWCKREEEGGVCVQLPYGQGHVDRSDVMTSPSQGRGSGRRSIHSSRFASCSDSVGD